MTGFSEKEHLRYTRHIQLPGVGTDGQQKLKQAQVLIIGCGGLGAPVSYYLAAAGVGKLTLVDADTVDLSNLQRQIIYTENDIGKPKASCSQQRLKQLNSDISIDAVCESLTPTNAVELISDADLVLDCTDNFNTRYLINDACKALGKYWLYASVYQFSGQCALFSPGGSCFRCLFPSAPIDAPDCNAAGVLGVLPGLLGTLQATEALRFLLGLPTAIENNLMLIETETLQFQKMALQTKAGCLCCQKGFNFNLHKYDHTDYKPVCSSDKPVDTASINAEQFDALCQRDDIQLIDVRDDNERAAFHLGGEHIPLAKINCETFDCSLLDKQKTLLLYCQSGVRSQLARDILLDKNLKALSIIGGIAQILKCRQNHNR